MTKQEKNTLNKINNLLKGVEEWRKDDAYRVNIVKWLIVKNYTDCETLEDLTDLLDNCVTRPSNTELLTSENVNEFEEEIIKRVTGHTKQYISRLDKSKGYLLHYPRIRKNNCNIFAPSYGVFFNLHDLETKPRIKPARFIVFGALWFDSVNGNTYNSAKIIDTKTRNIYYTRFCYGYGSQYLSEARDYIRENIYKRVDETQDIFNGGYMHTTKKIAKEHLF